MGGSRAGFDDDDSSSGIDTNELLQNSQFLAEISRMRNMMALDTEVKATNTNINAVTPNVASDDYEPEQERDLEREQPAAKALATNMASTGSSSPVTEQEPMPMPTPLPKTTPPPIHPEEAKVGAPDPLASSQSASMSASSSGGSEVCSTVRHSAPYTMSLRGTDMEAIILSAANEARASIEKPKAEETEEQAVEIQEQVETKPTEPVQVETVPPMVNASFNETDDEDDDEDDEEDDVYVVTWTHGPLGLTFRANIRGETVIRRVSRRTGTAEGLQFARKGDVLLAINDALVVQEPTVSVVARLQAPTLPMRLTFQPARLSDVDEEQYRPSSMVEAPPASVPLRPSTSASVSASVSVNSPSIDAGSEYEVVWSEGPLGCALKPLNGQPVVKSVSTKTRVQESVAQIANGDIMTEVNGISTECVAFRAVVGILESGAKPIRMRFHRCEHPGGERKPRPALTPKLAAPVEEIPVKPPRELQPNQYEVTWQGGPLGIQIKGSSNNNVVVSKHTETGDPQLKSKINVGDILVAIGDTTVQDAGVEAAFDLLRHVQKPVTLVLERVVFQARAFNGSYDPTKSVVPNIREMRMQEKAKREQMLRMNQIGAPRPSTLDQPVSLRPSTLDQPVSLRPSTLDQPVPSRPATLDQPVSLQQTSPQLHHSTSESEVVEWISTDDWARQNANGAPNGDVKSKARPNAFMSAPAPVTTAFQPPPPPAYTPQPPPVVRQSSDMLPRFSDIEAGRLATAPVVALPPPPAYDDIFRDDAREPSPMAMNNAPVPMNNSPLPVNHAMLPMNNTPAPEWPIEDRRDGMPPFGRPPSRAQRPSFMQTPVAPPPPPQYQAYEENAYSTMDSESRYQRLREEHMERERLKNQTPDALIDPGTARGPPILGATAAPRRPEMWMRWTEGPLGITFRRSHGQIVVSRLTGAGHSAGLEQLYPGDWLVRFGNEGVGVYMTKDLRLSETVAIIKRLPKPVDMWFITQ